MSDTSKKSRHLWQDSKPVTDVLKSNNVDELRTALKEENVRLKSVIAWLSGAYTTSEVIQILNACGFNENDIVTYGFDKNDILKAITTGTEMPMED